MVQAVDTICYSGAMVIPFMSGMGIVSMSRLCGPLHLYTASNSPDFNQVHILYLLAVVAPLLLLSHCPLPQLSLHCLFADSSL